MLIFSAKNTFFWFSSNFCIIFSLGVCSRRPGARGQWQGGEGGEGGGLEGAPGSGHQAPGPRLPRDSRQRC